MDDTIEIPITCKGKEYSFAAKLIKYGYIHRIEVDIDGVQVLFEPDEERNYRAIIGSHNEPNNEQAELIRAVIQVLDNLE
ncbi:hypothetical protein [Aridibaculum aurantiacum]|uniref:hypothetical protein n=1 Tax=Aridibaculum aurantiacum TaxID=2810307 RepID=UPI001A9655CE|nr:hypothetical protein [Aridibaculum aurantiacum]